MTMQHSTAVFLITLCLSGAELRSQETKPIRVKAKQRNESKTLNPERSRDRGLWWLSRHQADDGHWGSADFMKQCPQGKACDAPGNAAHDVGLTGLALLAFLRSGSNMRSGLYKENVKRGINWLRENLHEDGLIGEADSISSMYNHGIATLALVEGFGRSKYRSLKKYAQRSIDYILSARNPYKVWRYYPRDGDNDSSVTGWMLLALSSGKEYGLRLDKKALSYGLAWFDDVTRSSTGQVGYQNRGERSSRQEAMAKRFPSSKTEALTAIGLCCRIALGQTPKQEPIMQVAVDTILEKAPVWDTEDGSIDMYYWYFGTMALVQLDTPGSSDWLKMLDSALIVNQKTVGHERGSWDPAGAWGHSGGRVFATAIATLTLNAR